MRRFESHPCTANHLDDLLNDMAAQGKEPVHFIPVGAKRVENKLMPGQATIIPMIIVVFENNRLIDA